MAGTGRRTWLGFTMFLAPAERWLGRLRWVLVGMAAHVGAT
jgi:hypothetical protein